MSEPKQRRLLVGILILIALVTVACSESEDFVLSPEPTADESVGDTLTATTTSEPATSTTPVAEDPETTTATEETVAEEPAVTTTEPAVAEPVPVSPLFQGDFIDLNGESIDLASFEGQDVVLWYWAPW